MLCGLYHLMNRACLVFAAWVEMAIESALLMQRLRNG